jgi:hypothetical protein
VNFTKRLIQSILQNHCRVNRKHQVRKPGKSALGGEVFGPTKCEIGSKVHLVGDYPYSAIINIYSQNADIHQIYF